MNTDGCEIGSEKNCKHDSGDHCDADPPLIKVSLALAAGGNDSAAHSTDDALAGGEAIHSDNESLSPKAEIAEACTGEERSDLTTTNVVMEETSEESIYTDPPEQMDDDVYSTPPLHPSLHTAHHTVSTSGSQEPVLDTELPLDQPTVSSKGTDSNNEPVAGVCTDRASPHVSPRHSEDENDDFMLGVASTEDEEEEVDNVGDDSNSMSELPIAHTDNRLKKVTAVVLPPSLLTQKNISQ